MPDSERKSPEPGAHAEPPKPLLASDALREDLAPIEPGARAARIWSVALGLLLAGLALVPTLLMGGRHWTNWVPHAIVGGVALLAGAAPIPYALRAAALTFVAPSVAILGVSAIGPMGGVAHNIGQWSLLHLLAGAGLPAALLFRARYRAYAGARTILKVALLLALPFAAWCVLRLISGPLGVQISAGVALCAVATTLVGFMGSETTGQGDWIAAAVIASISAQLACEMLFEAWPPAIDVGLAWIAGSLLAFAACCILGAIGVSQLLARRHWDDAREVDLRRTKTVRPPMPSVGGPWSTRP